MATHLPIFNRRRRPAGEASDERERKARALDGGTRRTGPTRKIAYGSCHNSPRTAHRAPRHSGSLPVRHLFVDNQIERHDLRDVVPIQLQCPCTRKGKLLGKRQLERAIDRRGTQCCVFDHLDENAPVVGPFLQRVVKEMPRQTKNFAEVSMFVNGLRIHVVRGEVIASPHNQSAKITLLPFHAVQRVNVRGHRKEGDQIGVGLDQQLAPWPIHGQRLDVTSVSRETAIGYNPALSQPVHGVAVSSTI